MISYLKILLQQGVKLLFDCFWKRPVFRFSNALDLLRGPYQMRETLELGLEMTSLLDQRKTASILSSNSMSASSLKDMQDLGIQVDLQKGQFILRFPLRMNLYRATLFGWEPFLKGSAFKISPPSGALEMPLPGWGSWRIKDDFYQIDLHYLKSKIASLPLRKQVWEWMTSALTWRVVASAAMHVTLFLGLLNYEQIQRRIFSPPSAEVLTPEEEQAQEAAMQEPTLVEMVTEDSHEKDFHGMSIIAYLNKQVQQEKAAPPKEEQVKNLSQSLKGLARLLKAPVAIKTPLNASAKPTGKPSVGNLSGAFKSLQLGLVSAKGGGGTGIVGTGIGGGNGKGLQNVNWKSQFLATSASQGAKGLTEAQQQMIVQAFAKNQDRFRSCYESALLKFEELSVTVAFELNVTGDGSMGSPKFSLTGRATPDSQEALLGCLKSTLMKIKIDPKLSGVKVKNQFVFKS